jgi:anthranilate phosphoribosyltransferase
MTAPERTWPRLLATLLAREDLSADDTRWAMTEVMDDAHEPAQLAAFLTALRAKSETAAELGGMLDALMDRVIPLPVDGSTVTDVVGTGGDGAHTVNISTMAALVTAAAGTRVVKHGGRSVSSKSGSADVIEALGIPLSLTPDQVAAASPRSASASPSRRTTITACGTPRPSGAPSASRPRSTTWPR